ncbi:MAG: hypothetical protein NC133_02685 [Prevotella sp.]|nr:hypothetical protein [Prevotella sp.]
MKTNQTRATEIFHRAAAYQANVADNLVDARISRPRQVILRWVASVLVVILLMGTGIGLSIGLWKDRSDDNGIANFDKMYIANFANYQAIGTGSIGANAQVQPQALGATPVSTQNTDGKRYLVGVDQHNHVERCRVSRRPLRDGTQDDESYAIDYQVEKIYSFTRYTFVSFTSVDYNVYNSDWLDFYCYKSYVIDNLTGKFYSLNVFTEKYDYPVLYLGANGYLKDGYNCDLFESEDAVFVTVGSPSYNTNRSIYKIYVQGEDLVIEEVFDYSLNLGVEDYFVDKDNNIYLGAVYDYNYFNQDIVRYHYKYLISNGKLINLAEKIESTEAWIFRSLNGVCYLMERKSNSYYDYTISQYFGADGQLHDNDFDGCDYFFEKAEKVKSVGNTEYYLHKNELYRVTWENEVQFTVEKIDFSRDVDIKGYVATQDYLYIIEENQVSQIAITTGDVTALQSDYFFTAIQTDYLGNVVFNGNDAAMNKIIGTIANDGEITILTQARDYQIYYIAPVNH